ncbi:glycosyltransferase [Rubrobacter marinus]|uniref:glycosyltransferase n=1 Tax=Rubrobacter marinus TaxID=2653852 RepID=UPI0014088476|nr:glycosyltransferase [Rubrobacter marinus]
MEKQGPTLSVVVCARGERGALEKSLRSVLSQGWLLDGGRASSFEAIVVDDGDGPPLDLAGALPGEAPASLRDRVRAVRTRYRGMGAARSEGFDAALGTTSRGATRATSGARITSRPSSAACSSVPGWTSPTATPSPGGVRRGGAVSSAPFDPDRLAEENYIRASAAVFRTDAAHALGGFYPWLQAHEDWDLWLRMSRRCLLRHVPVAVAKVRACARHVPAGHRRRDLEWVTAAHGRRLALAASGGGARRGERESVGVPVAGPPTPVPPAPDAGERVPFDPESWGDGRRELAWHSVLRADEGYGTAGRSLLLALERRGVDVAAVSAVPPDGNAVPRGLERLFEGGERRERIGFYYSYKMRPSTVRCEKLATLSMWESTLVPRDHVEEINRASSLHFVPCRQNVESFRACGVRVPIKVLHHGVDTGRFPYLERDREGRPYTFGTFGDLSPRKGIDVLVRAFLDEFGPHEPVRLLLKSTAKASAYGAEDPRVETVGGYLEGEALLETLREMDAFVLPSRGEGFGLCGIEAMSTGLPLIATNWSGPSEYLDPADGFGLRYGLADAGGAPSGNVRYHGLWAEPDREHLRALMRHLYEHPEEGEAKGRAAADRVRRDWTWDRVAAQLVGDLDELARE